MNQINATRIVLFFILTLIMLSLIGCNQNIDPFRMHIEDVKIFITETDYDNLFGVTVRIHGIAGGTLCYGHHETIYLQRDDYAGHPLYRDGYTIYIDIFASGVKGGTCFDAVSTHDEVIFVGLFSQGGYTLHVNDYTTQFIVKSDL